MRLSFHPEFILIYKSFEFKRVCSSFSNILEGCERLLIWPKEKTILPIRTLYLVFLSADHKPQEHQGRK